MARARHKIPKKHDFPTWEVRRFIEPGPVLLLSSAWKGRTNIMTCGWHMVLETSPSTIGCMISPANHSFEMIRRSKECVINVPGVELAPTVVQIGNCSGCDIDKFAEFDLTAGAAETVKAPLVAECHANFECRLVDSSLIRKYSLFVFEVIKAHVASSPAFAQSMHYRGDGLFMVAGATTRKYRKHFKPEYL